MLQSGECFDGSRAAGKSALHTASEMRQSSPGWESEEAGPEQRCSGESGMGDSDNVGCLTHASAALIGTVVLLRLAGAGKQIDSGRFLVFS